MKSILDPSFKYVPPVKQDVAATFDRVCPGWRTLKAATQRARVVSIGKPHIRGKA